MLHTMKRGLLVGSVVAVVAALLSGSALAQRGHGHAQFGLRGGGFPFGGPGGPGGSFFGGGQGFGGPMFGGPGVGPFGKGGPGMQIRGAGGPGMGGPGGGLLASEVLKNAATFLQIPQDTLAADLKGGKTLAQEAVAKG